jgi:N-acetylneuraminic acid mutarotase
VLEYDTATGVWTKKKPMPFAIHHAAVAAYGDRVYLFGGFRTPERGGGWQPIDNAWEYDPVADAWKGLAPMSAPRGSAAVAAADGKFYVIGGVAAAAEPPNGQSGTALTIDDKRRHDVLARVEEYDLKADRWRSRTPVPTPRTQPAVVVKLGHIYVIGGRIGSAFASGSDTDIVEAYDPATDRWSAPLARLPSPRSDAGSALWRDLIVVAGGVTTKSDGTAVSSAVEAYDPAANAWKTLPPMPQPRAGFAAGVTGDRFYAVGGSTPAAADNPEPQKPGQTSVDASPLAQALQLDALTP